MSISDELVKMISRFKKESHLTSNNERMMFLLMPVGFLPLAETTVNGNNSFVFYLLLALSMAIGFRIGAARFKHRSMKKMFTAIENGDTQTIYDLINGNITRKKYDCDWQDDEEGTTAMMKACSCGNLEAVKILLEAKADIQLKDVYDKTAMDIATENDFSEIVQLLKNKHANSKTQSGNDN